jgi:hypothetical protein
MSEAKDSERRGEGEELDRDEQPESMERAVEGHGPEGKDPGKGTQRISKEGEHGQTEVSGDPGEPPDEK